MEQKRFITGHRILVVAESSEAPIEEVIPQRLGIGVGYRVIKSVECAIVAGEVFCDQLKHFLGDCIG